MNDKENSYIPNFSQTHGYEDIPTVLQLEELPSEARTRLWNVFYLHMKKSSSSSLAETHALDGKWKHIVGDIHSHFFCRPLDEWKSDIEANSRIIRGTIENDWFYKVFDLIEFVMRHEKCDDEFIESIQAVFEECQLAYRVDTNRPPSIFPRTTPEEGEVLAAAITSLHDNGKIQSVKHLQESIKFISVGDWSNSIRESINAVESVLRSSDHNKSSDLRKALDSLEKSNGPIHPALKEGILKLYGFSSDEPGVRHSNVDGKNSNLGQNEAILMLGVCASLANYLSRKFKD